MPRAPKQCPKADCWIWEGGQSEGYGHVRWQGRSIRLHRLAWILANGPVPEGMVVRHKCDVRLCYNIEHLELGTIGDNNRDMHERGRSWQASTTHCKRGHEYSPENTRIYNGWRWCKTCERQRTRVRRGLAPGA